jgi:hypothetical protein
VGKSRAENGTAFFYVDMLYSSSRPGVSALNDRKIRFYLIPEKDFEVSHFAGGAFTEAT